MDRDADSDTNVATPYQVILDATTGFILRYVPGRRDEAT